LSTENIQSNTKVALEELTLLTPLPNYYITFEDFVLHNLDL